MKLFVSKSSDQSKNFSAHIHTFPIRAEKTRDENSVTSERIGGQNGLEARRLAEPIFVGRKAEIKELIACLNLAIKKKGTTVFIRGEAGTGKTRLVKEFLKIVKDKELASMVGWCLSNARVPYFPFLEAFKEHSTAGDSKAKLPEPNKTKRELQIAARALLKPSKKVETPQKLSPKVWKDLTFTTVAEAMKAISELQPTILFIDDLHWADSASLALLHYISRVLASERVVIIATFRSEELHPNLEGQPHPLVETIRLMRREDLLKEINLSNLSQPDVVKVAEHMAGGRLDQNFVMRLIDESQGNPLFVVESMRMLLKNKQIVKEEGRLRLAATELAIPAKVKDIILRRLDSLKPDERRLLDLASVIGERFDPTLLGVALSIGILPALEALNVISVSTSLVHSDDNFYRFDHAKSREVLYGEIPSALKREYHAIIGETIEKTIGTFKRFPVNDLAFHYAQAAKTEKSLQYAVAAGEDALARFSIVEAINYFTYVLKTAPETPEHSDERSKALEGLGDAFSAKGMNEDAERAFEKLFTSENGVVRLRVMRKAMAASFWRGNLAYSLELANKAEEYASLDRLEYSRLLVWRGRVTGFFGNAEEALKDLKQALQVFEEEYSLPDVAHALVETANFYVTKGQVKKAIATMRRAYTIYRELEDSRGQMETLLFEANVFLSCELYQEAVEDYAKSIKIAEKLNAYQDLAMATFYSSLLSESIGDLEGALSKSLSALEYSEKTDSPFLKFNNYHLLTRQYAKLGRILKAEEFHKKVMKLFEEISQKSTRLAHAAGVHSNAVFSSAKQQWEEANVLFEESLELLKNALYSTLYEPIIRTDYASCLAKQGRMIEARKQTEESKRIRETLKSQLEPGEEQAFLMAKRETTVGEESEARLDIVNISRKPVQLLRIESVIPSALGIKSMPSHCFLQGDSIIFQGRKLAPFEVESIKFVLQPKRPGIFNLAPSMSYKDLNHDDYKEASSYAIKPLRIIVTPKASPELSVQTAESSSLVEFEFRNESAKRAFDFLLSSFVQDYMRRRLPLEWSGWRTLMEIVKHTNVSRHSIYGDGHSRGRAISELEQRGLVEARIFPKERGRGGKITKLRVFYEREIVKRRIDQEILAPGRKNVAPRSGTV